jgi:3-hydroxyacyl-CoA dehydrogenase/enoyl-CoA hydratase/3-hydroxybutyryl-CoA epimerase
MVATATKEEARKIITVTVEDGVAVLSIDMPGEPVNVLAPALGDEFRAVFEELSRDASVRAAVLISGKPEGFIAGADVKIIQKLTDPAATSGMSREIQEWFFRIEDSPKPLVAAIHGACLGGGCEIALACHYRIATDDPKTAIGQPEIQLGLIPGAGGTQRLPKLVGIAGALDLCLTGRQLRADRARKMGLVDEVVPRAILREVAVRRAREIADGKLRPALQREKRKLAIKDRVQQLALETNPIGRRVLFTQAQKKAQEKAKGHYPAIDKVIEAVRAAVELPGRKGYEVEARLFGECISTPVAKRLIEIFFATTALKKDSGTEDPNVKPLRIEKIGVLGAGLMGHGISYVSANAGYTVRMKDKDAPAVGRGLGAVRKVLDERVQKRSINRNERDKIGARLTGSLDYSGFKNADLVIEAVFEDIEVKRAVVREVEEVVSERCIFASNTSSLPITRIAEASKRPERVVGMHYFSPVHKMPLLEVITTAKSSPEVIATAVAVGKKQGKTVIVVRDGVGFYTSRIVGPYGNEAGYLLMDGAKVEEIDRALTDFGWPVGPLKLGDEVGLDVAAKVGHILHDAFGDRLKPAGHSDGFIKDGRFGRKTGKGFYLYAEGKSSEPDPEIYRYIPGWTHRPISADDIAMRCTLAFTQEAVRCLEEGILRSPRDGDIGAIFGLGFPPFLGGPFRWIDTLGVDAVVKKLEGYAEKCGPRFAPPQLLVDMAKQGKRFYP